MPWNCVHARCPDQRRTKQQYSPLSFFLAFCDVSDARRVFLRFPSSREKATPTAPCTRRPLPFVSPAFPPPSSRAAALPGEGVPVLGPAGVFFRAAAPRA
ncbi:hypothetical protein TcCL_ESM06631 [Trypanosoma cruzi]|nr:hypothetical protein TcCL_ESM06631 [Trypanosoma cruzi]